MNLNAIDINCQFFSIYDALPISFILRLPYSVISPTKKPSIELPFHLSPPRFAFVVKVVVPSIPAPSPIVLGPVSQHLAADKDAEYGQERAQCVNYHQKESYGACRVRKVLLESQLEGRLASSVCVLGVDLYILCVKDL